MLPLDQFLRLLARHARRSEVRADDALFDGGIDLSSLRFTEFIMDLEETCGIDIDVDTLDAGIVTAGQLHARLAAQGDG
ncbi:MAG: acyl carrier protein [Paracoccaceae bacterium]|nr:MAG: acyl carrier protein [Paracoccaceae bacterium]